MSASAYSFLPWLRRGVATAISTAPTSVRSTVTFQLDVNATATDGSALTRAVPRTVELYGPGDVVGIDARMIVRTDPRRAITDYEPNYLAAIEFFDEDFPWRYSPGIVDGAKRLIPWISLIVLRDDEFEDVRVADAVAPSITVNDAASLPPIDQLWAWAHVQINDGVTTNPTQILSDDAAAVMSRVDAVLASNADNGFSRLLSPRQLEPNTSYQAFVVPTFESGRLAGIGRDPSTAPSALHIAWQPYGGKPEGLRLPTYYRWSFRTGIVGDFEYLVRLLQPRAADPALGQRDVDVQHVAPGVAGLSDATLHGVLRLGGALRVPSTNLDENELVLAQRYENWDEPRPHAMQTGIAALVNLAEDYRTGETAHPDPVISPPLYGQWHAQTSRLLDPSAPAGTTDNWVHELNLDPRFRLPAGFGTRIVQRNQEQYMNAAWQQVGAVLDANRRIRLAQYGHTIASSVHRRHLAAQVNADPERVVVLAAPLHRSTRVEALTVAHQVKTSVLTAAPVSSTMRRITRPTSRIVQRAAMTRGVDGRQRYDARGLLRKLTSGSLLGGGMKAELTGVFTLEQALDAVRGNGSVAGSLLVKDFAAEAVAGLPRDRSWTVADRPPLLPLDRRVPVFDPRRDPLTDPRRPVRPPRTHATGPTMPELPATSPRPPEIIEPIGPLVGEPRPRLPTHPPRRLDPPRDSVDSVASRRYKEALSGHLELLRATEVSAVTTPRATLDARSLASAMLTALSPDLTVSRKVFSLISLPERFAIDVTKPPREVMAYPVIDVPMYKPLVDESIELFLPNINVIPQNTICLLETNSRFIESYLVGLNHEMARELLWRQYPTDQQGSYFRQFWDPSAQLAVAGESAAQRAERLRDVTPLHTWDALSKLGSHDQRSGPGEDVVLVIRGDLLKRYPNAVIYAQRAEWVLDANGNIDDTAERVRVALTQSEEAHPPTTKVRTALYEARVDPDISFFGFALSIDEANGDPPTKQNARPGWFFVIQERPGEPRFGFDIERGGKLQVWNDLAWADVVATGTPFVDVGGAASSHAVQKPTDAADQEKLVQWTDDKSLHWGSDLQSSEVAYIAYQAPVLVAVHASEMLHA